MENEQISQVTLRFAANRYLIGAARMSDEAGGAEKMVLCLDATRVLRQEEYDCLQSKNN